MYKTLLILLFVLITNNQQNQQAFTHPIVTELNGFTLLIVETAEPAESARFYTPHSYRVEWI